MIELVIKIPESEIPKQQDIIEIPLHFIDGKVCEAGGYGFDVLPKGHGRLIDADALEDHRQIQIVPCGNGKYTDITVYYQNDIDIAPTIIEADKGESEGI